MARSQSNPSWLQRWGSENLHEEVGSKLDPLVTYADFLQQLPQIGFRPAHLETQLSGFEEYCNAVLDGLDVELIRQFAAPALLLPVLRWSRDYRKAGSAKKFVERMESTIERVHDALLSRAVGIDRLLEFQNMLLFIYIIVCKALHVGLHPHVFNCHLFVYRKLSVATWSSFHPRLRLQYAALILHLSILFFPPDQPFKTRPGFSIKTMSDLYSVLKDAVRSATEQSLLTHIYVFGWFLDKLEAEVFWIQQPLTGSRGFPALTPGEQGAVVELVRRFSAYRYPVTADHLEHFLLQFGSTSRIRAAIRLLSHLRFFPLWQLAEAIEGILGEEIKKYGPLIIAPLGDRTGSTSIITYLASHCRLEKLNFVADVKQALEKTPTGGRIYFVDDSALSGTQTLNIVGDLLGTRKLKPHHTRYCEPLPRGQRQQLLKRTIVFVYCVACDFATVRLRRELPQIGLREDRCEVLFAAPEPLSVKAFGTISPVSWSSAAERDDLRQFCVEVGYDILAERAKSKSWFDERRHESSLGYSDFQRLLVFPYGVPKSTVTLLWQQGSLGRTWRPLFPVLD